MTKSELSVITNAKKLNEWLLIATRATPKNWRWNIVDNLLKISIEIIRLIHKANAELDESKRFAKQKMVDVELFTISHLIITAKKVGVFTGNQLEHASKLLLETRRSLWAWIRSETNKTTVFSKQDAE